MASVGSVFAGVVLALLGVNLLLPTKERASADCDARAVEHRLEGTDKARHKNLCMMSQGYKRNTVCDGLGVNQEGDLCYSYAWQFWVEGAMIVR